jgi:hypothetical protein
MAFTLLTGFAHSARLGSVCDSFTTSPPGSSLDFSHDLATTQLIAETEVMLCDGH